MSARHSVRSLLPLLLLAAPWAGCLGDDTAPAPTPATVPMHPTPDPSPVSGKYSITLLEAPSTAAAGETITVRFRVEGPEGTSDHVGAHFGAIPQPASKIDYSNSAAHQAGSLPGTFTTTWTIKTPGNYHYRAHVRTPDNVSFWSEEKTLDVKAAGAASAGHVLTVTAAPPVAMAGQPITIRFSVEGPAATSDHIGAHYGPTSQPSDKVNYTSAAPHQGGSVPGAFETTWTIVQPGTYYYRAHLRLADGKSVWSDEKTVAVAPAKVFKVGTEAPFPPFEDVDAQGNLVGFDIDVVREIAKRAAVKVEFQNMAFTALIPSLKSGQIDVAASAMTINDERKKEVDFSLPYYDANQLVAVRSGTTGVSKADDLAGKKVGTQLGTTAEAWLVEHLVNPGKSTNDSIVRYEHFPDAVAALKRGDVEAVMMDAPAVIDAIRTSNGEVKQAFPIETGEQYGLAVAKGNAQLLQAINLALQAMSKDGTLQALKEKWGV